MASGQIKMFGKLMQSMLMKEVSVTAGGTNLYAMLCTAAYTPDQDSHRYKADVTNEVSGTGYTAGGVQLSGVTVSYDAAANKVSVSCNAPSWTAITLTATPAKHLVIYDRTAGTDASRALIGYATFDTALQPDAGNLVLNLTSGQLFQGTTP